MKYEKRIGIDIGKVIIGGGDSKDDTSFFSSGYLKTPEVTGAIDSIAALRKVFGDNMWLVSKCGEKVQQKSLEWLRSKDFTRRTGIPEERFRFTPTRAGKAPIAEELGLTHFVDDRLEILGFLPKNVMLGFCLIQKKENLKNTNIILRKLS
jgi:hypothetical protein